MKDIEINEGNRIFQGFDMEKFFDKESLLDTYITLREISVIRITVCGIS